MKAITAFAFLLGVVELSSCVQLVYNAETPKCSTCLQIVSLAKARLEGSAKQSELRSVLDFICQQMPVGLQSTCTQFVAMKYDKMVELLLHHDALTVCNQFSQCESSTTSTQSSGIDFISVIKSLSKRNVGADECATCKEIYSVIETFFTSPTFVNSFIEFVTTDVCPRVTHEFPDCSDSASRYLPLLFSLLQQTSADAVCGLFKLCGSGTSGISLSPYHVKKQPAKVQDDCADCQTFIGDLQQRLSDPNQQQQLADTIANRLCPMLGSVFPQCASYAEEYVPIGLQMFEGLATSSVCQGISWCSSSASRSAATLFRDFAKLVNARPRSAGTSSGPTNDQCSDCEAFVTDAQKRYSDPAQQQVIIDLIVNQACPFLSNVFSQCAAYAQEYLPIGFQYLAGFSAQQVCQTITFCSSVAPEVIKPVGLLPSRKLAATSRLGDSCNDCTQFVADAQHFYSDAQNQQQVLNLVTNSLCPLISTIFADCVQFAQAEVPQLFILLESTDPSVICNAIGLCSGFRPARRFASGTHRFEMKPLAPKSGSSNDQYCNDCQVFFNDLQQSLNDPNNQQYITDELVNQVCPLVSQQFPECSQVMTEYLPFAFAAFESISSSLICTQLNFCSTSRSFATILSSVPKSGQLQASTLCSDCSLVVEVLSGVLQSSDTINELVATVTKVCVVVAEAGRPMCTAMLGAALRELIYTFQHSTDAQVCATFFAQCAQTQHINA